MLYIPMLYITMLYIPTTSRVQNGTMSTANRFSLFHVKASRCRADESRPFIVADALPVEISENRHQFDRSCYHSIVKYISGIGSAICDCSGEES